VTRKAGKQAAKATIHKIRPDIVKLQGWSDFYYIRPLRLLIDAGKARDFLAHDFQGMPVETIIFTHLHYDHVGHAPLFPKAALLASAESIEDFRQDPEGTMLDEVMASNPCFARLQPIGLTRLPALRHLAIIPTPGHSRGSICIRYQDILFTGDTFFRQGCYGRVDLPKSVPESMQQSIATVLSQKANLILPGHDY